eukprot:TRINITY_DN17103_c0_g1_i1.p1 TRINITY_DN17103_c0_g1~~TRINITY_DN17103_c0_g1_i1.p1  ORF type:complete len:872 (-),score=134.54 TRINITY_DN17103_c0_g1_i1:57-2312(-)
MSLKEFINMQEGKQIRGDLLLDLTHQLLSGLEFCHAHAIMHRNLHPAVIFINTDTAQPTLKIGGFQLACIFTPPEAPYDVCDRECNLLWYRAPERLLEGPCFLPSDVWSIGCILAEMACGIALFGGDSEIDQIFWIFRIRGTPTTAHWPDLMSQPLFKESFPKFKIQEWKDVNDLARLLGPAGTDLLDGLLCLDPNSRYSARQGVRHAWFGVQQDEPPVTRRSRPTRPLLPMPQPAWQLVRRFLRANQRYAEEYAQDMRAHAELEERRIVSLLSSGVPHQDRNEVVHWLFQTNRMLVSRPDSFFLALRLFDVWWASEAPVETANGRVPTGLACITALLLAFKAHKVFIHGLPAWLQTVMTSMNFTQQSIMQMELNMLKAVDFQVFLPTVRNFILFGADSRVNYWNGWIARVALSSDESCRRSCLRTAAVVKLLSPGTVSSRAEVWQSDEQLREAPLQDMLAQMSTYVLDDCVKPLEEAIACFQNFKKLEEGNWRMPMLKRVIKLEELVSNAKRWKKQRPSSGSEATRQNDMNPAMIQVFVKALSGKSIIVKVLSDADVASCLEGLPDEHRLPSSAARFSFQGRYLRPGAALRSYGVGEGSTLHMTSVLLSRCTPEGSAPAPDAECPRRRVLGYFDCRTLMLWHLAGGLQQDSPSGAAVPLEQQVSFEWKCPRDFILLSRDPNKPLTGTMSQLLELHEHVSKVRSFFKARAEQLTHKQRFRTAFEALALEGGHDSNEAAAIAFRRACGRIAI